MAQNTNQLEGYTVFSSVSLNGSGATLKAADIVASRYSSSKTLIDTEIWASTLSASKITSSGSVLGTEVWGSIVSGTQIEGVAGSSDKPSLVFTSEVSLGFYRSAASTVAQSYGTFKSPGLIFTTAALGSSATTNQSNSTAKVADTALFFSVLSATLGMFGFRSGNSVYCSYLTVVG